MVTQLWRRELGSAILLLISVAAMPATLYPHDGQPLPQWPFSISINALLSIYSMVLKACLAFLVTSCIGQLQWSWYLEARPLKDVVLFHEAANGTLGSVRWLWVNRFRQPLTALGAIITIVALAIDPFVQQLVHAVDCKKILSNDIPVSVPRTNYFNRNGFEASLKPSIPAGLNTFQNLTDFDCSTGNFTFRNTYTSLAICSQCSDRSSEVVVDGQCGVESFAADTGDIILHQEPCDISRHLVTTVWNLTTSLPPFDVNFYVSSANRTPDVFSIQAQQQSIGVNVPRFEQIVTGLKFGVILGNSDSAISKTDPSNSEKPIYDCDHSPANGTWRCRGYGAAECVLQPCVQTYSCSIEAGRIKETIVEESNLNQIWGFGDPSITMYLTGPLLGLLDLQCITDVDRRNLIQNGYHLDNAGRWLSYNTTLMPTIPANASSTFPRSLLANGCLYVINPFSINTNLFEILSPFLVGNVTRKEQPYRGDYVFEGTEQILHLYDSGNVSMESVRDMFANLAQTLTLWVRSNGGPSFSRRAEGDVLHYAVCVRVVWSWISLSAAVAGLALVMLALTVATTSRKAVPMWKLFPLAVLLYGPAGENWVDRDLLAANTSKEGEASSRDDNSVDGMSKLASRVSVQLLEQDGKFQLRQVGVPSKKVQY